MKIVSVNRRKSTRIAPKRLENAEKSRVPVSIEEAHKAGKSKICLPF